jgi:hypothetical protein
VWVNSNRLELASAMISLISRASPGLSSISNTFMAWEFKLRIANCIYFLFLLPFFIQDAVMPANWFALFKRLDA